MNYTLEGDVAVLQFDDGKANVVGHDFVAGINEGLDRSVAEAAAVVICGREGMFSGGFDLAEFKKGAEATVALTQAGFEMLTRMYGHPQPLLVACTGHAVAAGAFMLLAADTRVGTEGPFKFSLPETALGMPLPPLLHELARARLSKRHLTPVLLQAQPYDPVSAVDAGFLDELAAAGDTLSRTLALAAQLAQLPGQAYARNKRDMRASSLERMRNGMQLES